MYLKSNKMYATRSLFFEISLPLIEASFKTLLGESNVTSIYWMQRRKILFQMERMCIDGMDEIRRVVKPKQTSLSDFFE